MNKTTKSTFNTEKFIENLNSVAAKKICDSLKTPMASPTIVDYLPHLGSILSSRNYIEAPSATVDHLDDRTVYYINVAGFKKDKLEINISDNILVVTGKDGGLKGLSNINKSIPLSKDVDLELSKVELEDGILRISIGKKTKRITKLHIK
jgi:HSP20 family molecular chaperone IbpA